MKSINYDPNLQKEKGNRKWFKNVKLIGEIGEGTSIYIEDYAHTYLNQCANSDISYELCAVLIGEHHKECKQMIVYGVIPVDPKLLDKNTHWISENVLGTIEDERKCYFPEGEYVGWMHTQPGYGIMPTTKEMTVHKEIFGDDCILMLMDPLYHTEAFFTCHKDKFEEKKGFCIYYEKNELMQKYMEDHSLLGQKQQEENDKVVGDFRELGAKWKLEAERKRKKNRLVSMTVAGVLLAVAFTMGIQSQQKKINGLQKDMINIQRQYTTIENKIPDYPVELVFTSSNTELELESDVKVGQDIEPEADIEVEPDIPVQPQYVYDTHAVEMGDSLLSISYNYYNTVAMAKEIANLNSIKNEDTIYIGQKLKLPKKVQ